MPPRRPLRCLAPTVVRAAPGVAVIVDGELPGRASWPQHQARPAGRIDPRSPGPQPPSVHSSVEEAIHARPRHRGRRRLGRRRGSARRSGRLAARRSPGSRVRGPPPAGDWDQRPARNPAPAWPAAGRPRQGRRADPARADLRRPSRSPCPAADRPRAPLPRAARERPPASHRPAVPQRRPRVRDQGDRRGPLGRPGRRDRRTPGDQGAWWRRGRPGPRRCALPGDAGQRARACAGRPCRRRGVHGQAPGQADRRPGREPPATRPRPT